MQTITFRLTDTAYAAVSSAAARDGLTVSAYIREALDLGATRPTCAGRIDALEHRVVRIEVLANLD